MQHTLLRSLLFSLKQLSFDGTLLTDSTALDSAGRDFGNIVHRLPIAVLKPGSIDDVIKIVQFAREHKLKIAPRGQGHSTNGQSQVEGGIVIDLSSLKAIHSIKADRIMVDAGILWKDLLLATLEHCLTPPVLTDYLELSVGGTLSVGGIGGTSYCYGAQIDNVLELEVVTGEGRLETCSLTHQPNLFKAVLAGLGQCGIIVRATLKLITAHPNVRAFDLFYPDLATLIHDQQLLIDDERFNVIEGDIAPTLSNKWIYKLEVAIYYTPDAEPDNATLLTGLNYTGLKQLNDTTYFEFSNRVATHLALFKDALNYPHPWSDVFILASVVNDYISYVLANLTLEDVGKQFPIILYALKPERFTMPLLCLPSKEEKTVFLFGILRTVPPDPEVVAKMLIDNKAFYEHNRGLGGTHYCISSIQLYKHEWQLHFGAAWEEFVNAKKHFDPDNILTPGQEIF